MPQIKADIKIKLKKKKLDRPVSTSTGQHDVNELELPHTKEIRRT